MNTIHSRVKRLLIGGLLIVLATTAAAVGAKDSKVEGDVKNVSFEGCNLKIDALVTGGYKVFVELVSDGRSFAWGDINAEGDDEDESHSITFHNLAYPAAEIAIRVSYLGRVLDTHGSVGVPGSGLSPGGSPASTGAPAPQTAIPAGERVNDQPYATFAVFCRPDGSLAIDSISAAGQGGPTTQLSLPLSAPVITSDGIEVYQSPDLIQIRGPWQSDGKRYVFEFNGCPASAWTAYMGSNTGPDGSFVLTETTRWP